MHVTAPVAIELKQRVLAVLRGHDGKQNAIKGMEIASKLGMLDDRAVQQAIEELIKIDHEPIASSCSENRKTGTRMGYYFPATTAEEDDYIHQLRSRAKGVYLRYRWFRKACKMKHERARQEQLGIYQPVLFN